MRFLKETNEAVVIENIVKSMSNLGKNMIPHFIYCGSYFNWKQYLTKIREKLLKFMKQYGIQSCFLTALVMTRRHLITKEKMKQAYKGELKDTLVSDFDSHIYGS